MNVKQIKQNQHFVLFQPPYAYAFQINKVLFIIEDQAVQKHMNLPRYFLVYKMSNIQNLQKLDQFSFSRKIHSQPQIKAIPYLKANQQEDTNLQIKRNIYCKIRSKLQQNFIIFPKYSTRLKQIKKKKKVIQYFKTICEKNKKAPISSEVCSTKCSTNEKHQLYNINQQNKFDQSQQKEKIISIVNFTDQQPIKQQFFQNVNNSNKYFFLQKRSIIMQTQNNNKKQQLIIKRCKNKEQQKSAFALIRSNQKMIRQLNIINNLSPHKNLLWYYKKQNQINQFYMESIRHCLKVYVQMQQLPKLNLKQKLQICLQLIQVVLHLHSQKVVHRDIKPENILFQIKEEDKIQLKIIDFSDSVYMEENYHDLVQNLGCTLPFSHILCLGKQGFKDKKVDFWSVGAVIYWLIFGQAPIKVHQAHKMYCYEKWPELFCHQINLRYHQGRLTEYLIKFMCLRLMRIKLSLLDSDDLQISKELFKKIIQLQNNQNIQTPPVPQKNIQTNNGFSIILLKPYQKNFLFNWQQQGARKDYFKRGVL